MRVESILLTHLSPKSGRSIYEAKTQTSGILLHDMMNNFSLFDLSSPSEPAIGSKVILLFRAAPPNISFHSGNGPPSAPFV